MSNDTPQDARIRALIVELSESSPLAPTAEELGLNTQPTTAAEDAALPSYTEVTETVVKDNPKGRKIFGGLAAAAALLAGGSVAFNAASDNSRATPEAAVEQLLDAMVEEDALGIIEAIDPNERRALTPHIDDIVAELERVEILQGADAEAVSGFDFNHEGVELDSRQLGDDVWAVRLVEGTFSSSTDQAALPLVPGLTQTQDVSNFATDLDEWVATWPELFSSNGFEVVVTNNDGWHVNVLYTFLEQARRDQIWPVPDYAIPLTPAGADSPEAAAQGWLEAQGRWDVAAIIDLLDPVEMPALHRYADQLATFIGDEQLNFAAPDSDFALDQFRVDGEGSERTVVIERFTLNQRYDAGIAGEEDFSITTSFDGECRETASAQADIQDGMVVCLDDEELDPPARALIAASPIEVRVVERDGAWFVSPVGTVIDGALDALRVRDADGFDIDTVFLTLFEIPVLPFFSPGSLNGFIGVDASGLNDGFALCDPGFVEGLRSQADAEADAEAFRSCLAENDIDAEGLAEPVAMVACSYIWNFDGPELTLDEALTVSEAYEACILEEGGGQGLAGIVGDFFCSSGFEAEPVEQLEHEACLEQFGIDRSEFFADADAPIVGEEAAEIPAECEPAFAELENGIVDEDRFEELVAEFPVCFGEPPGE